MSLDITAGKDVEVAGKKIVLGFISPTNPSEILNAEVSTDVTPKFLVGQLVEARFIPPAGSSGLYKLRDARTGRQLVDNESLREAGLVSDTEIAIDHATSGAFTGGAA